MADESSYSTSWRESGTDGYVSANQYGVNFSWSTGPGCHCEIAPDAATLRHLACAASATGQWSALHVAALDAPQLSSAHSLLAFAENQIGTGQQMSSGGIYTQASPFAVSPTDLDLAVAGD